MIDWFVTGFTAVLLWLSLNGFQPSHIAAGFFGALARTFVAKTGTLKQRFVEGFFGSLFAVYCTPILAVFLGVTDVQMMNAVAFAVGLMGIYIADALMALGREYASDPGKLKDAFKELLVRLIAPKGK
jgi:hypothetical protein